MELEADLVEFINNKNTPNSTPATIRFKDKTGVDNEIKLKIRARGKFRRRICEFPPLKLNFSKSDLQKRGFKKLDKISLVTHCFQSKPHESFILKEYLVYKLYELVSDHYFRVQLVRIKYICTASKKKYTRYGILLEDDKEIAKRINAKVCEECYNKQKEDFKSDNLYTQELFQFMISNTDWSIPLAKNLKLFQPEDSSHLLVIPYDFDYSGFVYAPYIRLSTNYGQTNPRDRRFIGFANNSAEIAPVISLFESKKEEILEFVRNFKTLNYEDRMDLIEFLESFFELLEDDQLFSVH